MVVETALSVPRCFCVSVAHAIVDRSRVALIPTTRALVPALAFSIRVPMAPASAISAITTSPRLGGLWPWWEPPIPSVPVGAIPSSRPAHLRRWYPRRRPRRWRIQVGASRSRHVLRVFPSVGHPLLPFEIPGSASSGEQDFLVRQLRLSLLKGGGFRR